MEIKGKSFNFLGDSLTEVNGHLPFEWRYVNVFARKYSPGTVRNYGIGGTRIARQQTPSANPVHDKDFCSRVEGMENDADFVIVFGGTNDFGHGDAPLGTMDDRTPDTFYGACHTLMRSLIEKYPASTIIFMTPTHRACETRANRPPLVEFVKIIREVAEFYSIPVCDLYKNLGIQPQIQIQKEMFTQDGLHTNDKGAQRVADRLASFILTL